jgi:preprotein translocase subunit SecD
MKITKNTMVSAILKQHGDIAEIMEIFGVKRVGGFALRKMITKLISVRTAAFVHRVPLIDFISLLETAIENKEVRE